MEGTRPLTRPALTSGLCGQNVFISPKATCLFRRRQC